MSIFVVYFVVTLLIAMSEEEQQRRLDRLKAVHCSVITKLSRELDGIIQNAAEEAINTNPRKVARPKVIYEQLNGKLKVLNDLDGEIVSICPVDDIEKEIEDAEAVIARLIEAKPKIDSTLEGNPREVATLPPTNTTLSEMGRWSTDHVMAIVL